MDKLEALPAVPGLDAAERRVMQQLVTQFNAKRAGNDTRTAYYLGDRLLSRMGKMGMAMPETLGKLETVLGWPAKSVTTLEHRLNIRGFVVPGEADRDEGLEEIAADNNLLVEASMTHTASLVHGTAFVTVSKGDESIGEPPVVIAARSAREATALYSRRQRRIVAGLTVNEGTSSEPDRVCIWLDDRVLIAERDGQSWRVQRQPHRLGRPPMEMLSFRPHIEREFGVPRITKTVMGLTDAAARTMLRMEGTAEFFSFPQRYALGVEQEDFSDTFKTYLNRFLAIGRDDAGELPQMGEFSSSSPQPHIEQLRAIASMFSGETSIPLNYLGIVHDNPASADAIRAAEADLITVAERAQTVYGAAWSNVMRLAQAVRDGGQNPKLKQLHTQWHDPATPTKAATGQTVMALVSQGILPGASRVTWELLGYDEATISRLEADFARQRTSQILQELKPADEVSSQAQSIAASVTTTNTNG